MIDTRAAAVHLGLLPLHLEHQLDRSNVAVVAADSQGNVLGAMSTDLAPWDTPATMPQLDKVSEFLRHNSPDATSIAVVVFDPQMVTDAQAAGEVLDREWSTVEVGLVSDGSLAMRALADADWRERAEVPDAAAHAATEGRIVASNRAALVSAYTPLDEPYFDSEVPPEVREIASARPSTKGALAMRNLDELATLEHAGDALRMRVVASLANDHIAVRDALAIHGASTREHHEALVQTFRAAPPQWRQRLAEAAGAAAAVQDRRAVSAVLFEHAPGSTLATLVKASQEAGLDIAARWPSVSETLELADANFLATQTRQASFPTPAKNATQERSGASQQDPGVGPKPSQERGGPETGR